MAPVYKEENYNSLDLGPEMEKTKDDKDDDEESKRKKESQNRLKFNGYNDYIFFAVVTWIFPCFQQKVVFKTPKKQTTRNPPFELDIAFDQYRRGREYTSKILIKKYFTSSLTYFPVDGVLSKISKYKLITF